MHEGISSWHRCATPDTEKPSSLSTRLVVDSLSMSEWSNKRLTFAQTKTLNECVDAYRREASSILDASRKGEFGQFFTPASTAEHMASWLGERDRLDILDAGAGVGSLTAACVQAATEWNKQPERIHATTFEIDPLLIPFLRSTLNECALLCAATGIEFTFDIEQGDFIEKSVEMISGQRTLFDKTSHTWNIAILNPPYRKIQVDSHERLILRRVGIETSNLYTGFLWLATKLLTHDSELIAITPRSFCNGPYFLPFRQALLKEFAFERVHVYASRNQAFRDDDVLQENIIFKVARSTKIGATKQNVVVSVGYDADDYSVIEHTVTHAQIVQSSDPDQFIHVTTDDVSLGIRENIDALSHDLKSLGLNVSTGRVVDFRAKHSLRENSIDGQTVPLIYPIHISDGFVKWPAYSSRKPNTMVRNAHTLDLLIPSDYYVIVKRFSAKEEKKRIVAATYDPYAFDTSHVGFENHLNYFHRNGHGLEPNVAKGLMVYLNSTLVDQYFRQFNGHTQVNATDLRRLKYPALNQLTELGAQIKDTLPSQTEIDHLVGTSLNIMAKNNKKPTQSATKLNQALNLLRELPLPREQQNERSALTLLALLDLKPATGWNKASSPLRGITEIMDYARDHYSVSYAPNTRETFRRFTMHQFVQSGLVVVNPDQPDRPTNSPKTCYQIDGSALKLIRTYGTNTWNQNLAEFVSAVNGLRALQAKEREMQLIPVSLPNGDEVRLSGGGQNSLIKKIIEEFCPRYTPAGVVIYIGDVGRKIRGDELAYMTKLGITINEHGKMPDVVVHFIQKDWLVVIEAVTSHGPINIKRHNELKILFADSKAGVVFVTAFETRSTMKLYLREIAWETDVWVAEAPSHLIHFNGNRFLGPYSNSQ